MLFSQMYAHQLEGFKLGKQIHWEKIDNFEAKKLCKKNSAEVVEKVNSIKIMFAEIWIYFQPMTTLCKPPKLTLVLQTLF